MSNILSYIQPKVTKIFMSLEMGMDDYLRKWDKRRPELKMYTFHTYLNIDYIKLVVVNDVLYLLRFHWLWPLLQNVEYNGFPGWSSSLASKQFISDLTSQAGEYLANLFFLLPTLVQRFSDWKFAFWNLCLDSDMFNFLISCPHIERGVLALLFNFKVVW